MLPKSIKNLIEEFSKLPGIGPKSAQRLAMHLIKSPHSKIEPLGKAVLGLKEGIVFCETCFNIAESSPCRICGDAARDQFKICVVEEVLDAAAIEKTGEYNGVYHVLHGVLSPVDGVGPEELKLTELVNRVGKLVYGSVEGGSGATEGGSAGSGSIGPGGRADIEIILATNPSLEGEATALYVQKQLREFDIRVTRLARGLPTGGDIEYSDDLTLSRAMKGRGEY